MLNLKYRYLFPVLMLCMGNVLADETAAPAKPAGDQRDLLELDPSAVTGNQELPKVLYIVPWKHVGTEDLVGRPVNTLLDEVLAPIDREAFQRQVRYFYQLHAADSKPVASE